MKPNHRSILVAIPVWNEERHIDRVLSEVRRYASDILVVDDGSTDATPALLARHPVEVLRHGENMGYGRSMRDIIHWAHVQEHEWVVTMDCDEQHEPSCLPAFFAAARQDRLDVISGSRYLSAGMRGDDAPADRRAINRTITGEVNRALGLALTDAFCGVKAYRARSCARLALTVDGYDFPMQFWVQAAAHRLRIGEIAVPRIYHDPNRSFGGGLDDPSVRLAAYRDTFHRELRRCRSRLRTPSDGAAALFEEGGADSVTGAA
ncbi:MAG: glycosyltransferase family 2 protein [Phycisphaerales bacterium]|nr:glycosyltransferase family 2 protein [Phycisphaerales bacterium]